MTVTTIFLRTQETNISDLCRMGCTEFKKLNGIKGKVKPIGVISQPHKNRAFILIEDAEP